MPVYIAKDGSCSEIGSLFCLSLPRTSLLIPPPRFLGVSDRSDGTFVFETANPLY